jgi:hypothetical protein
LLNRFALVSAIHACTSAWASRISMRIRRNLDKLIELAIDCQWQQIAASTATC